MSSKLLASNWSILQGGPGLKGLAKVGLQLFKGIPFEREKAMASVGDFHLLKGLKTI